MSPTPAMLKRRQSNPERPRAPEALERALACHRLRALSFPWLSFPAMRVMHALALGPETRGAGPPAGGLDDVVVDAVQRLCATS